MAKRVLVVDDSGVVRKIGAMTLMRAGFEVVDAVDGRDALEKASNERFDLVITDINMPGMDGIELIKELRTLDDYRFIPIVVLSTLAQKDKVDEGKQAGASGWIFKPFSATKLLDTVGKFVQ